MGHLGGAIAPLLAQIPGFFDNVLVRLKRYERTLGSFQFPPPLFLTYNKSILTLS